MPKSKSGDHTTLNRRQALLLPAAAGIEAALALPANASDSTKTAAHQAPGVCATPRSAVAKTQYGKVRGYVDAGVLTIDHVESEQTGACRDINYDPLVLPSGIAPSDDPLLSARSATYSQSFTRRAGETREPSAVTPAEIRP